MGHASSGTGAAGGTALAAVLGSGGGAAGAGGVPAGPADTAIAVNVATFIGLKLNGFWGGVFATLGTIFPSMVIISIIALFLTQFENNPIVVHAFAGIRACVCILILDAVIKLGKKSVKDKGMFFIFLAILALALFAPFSPVISVLIAAAVGYFMKPYADKSIKGGSEK